MKPNFSPLIRLWMIALVCAIGCSTTYAQLLPGFQLGVQMQGEQIGEPMYVVPENRGASGFPIAYVNQVAGAPMIVATTTDMLYIPQPRLTTGMLVYIVNNDETYRLIRRPAANTSDINAQQTQMSDWTLVGALSYGSGRGPGGSGGIPLGNRGSGDNFWDYVAGTTHITNKNTGTVVVGLSGNVINPLFGLNIFGGVMGVGSMNFRANGVVLSATGITQSFTHGSMSSSDIRTLPLCGEGYDGVPQYTAPAPFAVNQYYFFNPYISLSLLSSRGYTSCDDPSFVMTVGSQCARWIGRVMQNSDTDYISRTLAPGESCLTLSGQVIVVPPQPSGTVDKFGNPIPRNGTPFVGREWIVTHTVRLFTVTSNPAPINYLSTPSWASILIGTTGQTTLTIAGSGTTINTPTTINGNTTVNGNATINQNLTVNGQLITLNNLITRVMGGLLSIGDTWDGDNTLANGLKMTVQGDIALSDDILIGGRYPNTLGAPLPRNPFFVISSNMRNGQYDNNQGDTLVIAPQRPGVRSQGTLPSTSGGIQILSGGQVRLPRLAGNNGTSFATVDNNGIIGKKRMRYGGLLSYTSVDGDEKLLMPVSQGFCFVTRIKSDIYNDRNANERRNFDLDLTTTNYNGEDWYLLRAQCDPDDDTNCEIRAQCVTFE